MSCRIISLIYYISQIIAPCPQAVKDETVETMIENLLFVFLQIPEFLRPGKYKREILNIAEKISSKINVRHLNF